MMPDQIQQVTALVTAADGKAVDGIRIEWSSSNSAVAEVDDTGAITAHTVGDTDIKATAGLLQDSVRIIVQQTVPPDDVPTLRFVTTPSVAPPAPAMHQSSPTRVALRRVAFYSSPASSRKPPMFFQVSDPLPSVQASPRSNIGRPSNAPLSNTQNDSTVFRGSSNYSKSFPVVGLSGRGENSVSLAAAYNSQVWTFDPGTNTYFYNVNHDWPAPGFNLNFGKLLPAPDGTFLIVMGDGTRHVTTSTLPLITTDGSLIQLFSGGAGNYIAYFPDGSVIYYQNLGGGNYWYPTKINDRNGNFFTISYNAQVPQINYITDNLGRVVQFNYDGSGNLTSIDAPDLSLQRRTVVQFAYTTITVSSSFTSGTVVFDGSTTSAYTVPSRIYYPQTGTGYLLTYGGYGMISHLSQRVGMTATLDGTEISYTDYNYPTSGPLSDIPRFTQRQESWINPDPGVTVPVTYTYSDTNDGTNNIFKVTDPLSNSIVQKTPMSGSFAGALTVVELQDSSGTALQRTTTTWETDSLLGNTPRVNRVDITDVAAGLTKHTEFSYPASAPTWNNITEQREYGFAGELLRKTDYTYVTSSNYMQPMGSRPAIGLPRLPHLLSSQSVYDGPSGTLASHVEFDYDSTTLTDRTEGGGAVTGHNRTLFPSTFIYRGNQSAIRQYPDYVNQPTNVIQRHVSYDILGNVISAELSCCQSKTFTFIPDNHYCWPSSITSGSGPSLSRSYTYDLSTSLTLTQTDENSRVTTYSYLAGSLRPNQTTSPTSAYTTFAYDDANLKVTQTSYDATNTQVGQSESTLNASGLVQKTRRWAGGTAYDRVDVQYDSLLRPCKQSNKYREGVDSQQWRSLSYDALGRTTAVTLPDSETVTTDYNGQYVRATDQVGRQRIRQSDGLGRTINVIEVAAASTDYPGSASQTTPWGTVSGYSTTYTYDVLDNVSQVSQGGQSRLFVYDGLSRTTYEKQAEETGTISFNGQSYSRKYEYDQNNLRRTTDDRGAVITYFYDGINRLTSKIYSGSPTAANFYYFWDGTTSLTVPADAFGAGFSKTTTLPSGLSTANSSGRITAVSNDGSTGGDFYQYGPDGEVTGEVERISGTDYWMRSTYNSLLLPITMTYPSGRQLNYYYDAVQRPQSVTEQSTGINYASNLTYNGADQVTGLSLGDGTSESFTYDSVRQQLTDQQVTKGTSTLLNLHYNYNASAGQHGIGTTAGNSGQLIAITDNLNSSGSVNYSYDLLGRLKTANSGMGWNLAESYDRYGNRTGQTNSGSAGFNNLTRSDTYDSTMNRVTTTGFSYDNSGNQVAGVTSGTSYTYSYDAENRLTQVNSTQGTATYGYNSGQTRVSQSFAGATNIFVYARSNQLLAKAESGVWRDYIYLGSRLIAEATSSGKTYHHQDRLSTRLLTDASGNILSQQQTAPFGEVVSDTSPGTTKRKYTSYERDTESGNDNAVNRQYASDVGRFTQPDPIRAAGVDPANPQSFNLYGYTMNDPVNSVDPLGLFTCFGYFIVFLTVDAETGRIISREDGGFIPVFCWDDGGEGGVGGGDRQGGGGGGSGQSTANPTHPGEDFKKFLQTMSDECKKALSALPGGVLDKLSKLADSANIYEVNQIQDQSGSKFFGQRAGKQTVGEYYDNFGHVALTTSSGPLPGIYIRGVSSAFSNDDSGHYFELHELTHLAFGKGKGRDLDESLGRALGLSTGKDGDWSAAVSTFFNSKCTQKGP